MSVFFEIPARHGAWIHGRSVVSAHLMADTTEELLAFAAKMGLKEEWIQHRGQQKEHFDLLGEAKCNEAERLGAIRCDRQEFVRRWKSKSVGMP